MSWKRKRLESGCHQRCQQRHGHNGERRGIRISGYAVEHRRCTRAKRELDVARWHSQGRYPRMCEERNRNTAAKQAGSNRTRVLIGEVKDAQGDGKHVGAVWRTRQNHCRYRREACDGDTSNWNSRLALNYIKVTENSAGLAGS